jgi:hypothetical protein
VNRKTISETAYRTIVSRGPMRLADLRLAVPELTGAIIRGSRRLEVVNGFVQQRGTSRLGELIRLVAAAVWKLGGKCSTDEVARMVDLDPAVAEFILVRAAAEAFVRRVGSAWVIPLLAESLRHPSPAG